MNKEQSIIFAHLCLQASGDSPNETFVSISYLLRCVAHTIYLYQSYQHEKYLGTPAPALFLSWIWGLINIFYHNNPFLFIWFILETTMFIMFLKLEFQNKPLLYGLFLPTSIFIFIFFELFTSEIPHGLISSMITNLIISVAFTFDIIDIWKQKEESSEFITWPFLFAGIYRQISTFMLFYQIHQIMQPNTFLTYSMSLCLLWDTVYNIITYILSTHHQKQNLPHQNQQHKLLPNLEKQGDDILSTPLLY